METSKPSQFLNPLDVVTQAGITKSDMVADFGCAAGYFTMPTANLVGEDGSVIAIDVLLQALDTIKSKARLEGLKNITLKQANIEKINGSGIDDSYVNWVILKNVLFMNEDRETILKEAHRVLIDGGKILIVEWNSQKYDIGPELDIRVPEKNIRALAENIGFVYEKNVSAGDYHYSIVLQKR